eukprot:Hpha_TRINITY_DN15829_c1_g14::TRINITY_DN15829_c1_g14_i1::g.191223::m.191223
MAAVEGRDEEVGTAEDRLLPDGSVNDILDSVRKRKGEEEDAESTDNGGDLSVFAATVGLAQNIMGSGLLALPYAFRSGGLGGAGALLLVATILSLFTMSLLPALADHFGAFGFQELAVLAGSQRAGKLLEAGALMYSLGICMGYCVFVGDFVCALVGDHLGFHLSSRLATVAVTGLIFWPLSCAKSLGALAPLTVVGVLGILYSTVAVIVRYADSSYPSDNVTMEAFDGSRVGNTFPILVVAFGAHFNVLRFYKELRDRSQKKMAVVISVSAVLAALVYGAAGIAVYATFGSCTDADFSKNYHSDDKWIIVVRCFMLFALCVSFPLVMVSARGNVASLAQIQPSFPSRFGITTVLTGICLGVAVAAGDPGPVLDYNGSVFGTPVCYIAPPTLYLMMPRDKQSSWLRAGSVLCIIAGIAFAALGVVEVTLQQIDPGSDGSNC